MPNAVTVSRTVFLCHHNGGARSDADKQVHKQVNERTGNAAHCGKRLLSDELSYNNCIYRIIKLLKKRSQ